MSRRSQSSATIADRTFPVRIKIEIPPNGLGQLIEEVDRWLLRELGAGNYGQGPASAIGYDASAWHFRSLADAQRFLDAFPELDLAMPKSISPPIRNAYG